MRLSNSSSGGRPDPWADLIVAILSVNNYPLDKTFAVFDRLQAQGLFSPANYLTWSAEIVASRLVEAGYDRGAVMTDLMVKRLVSLKSICEDITLAERLLSFGDRQVVTELLKSVKGVGPQVLENYFLLRGDVDKSIARED